MTVTVPDVFVFELYQELENPDLDSSSAFWNDSVISDELSVPRPTVSLWLEQAPRSKKENSSNTLNIFYSYS